MEYWIIKYTQLWKTADLRSKILDMPQGSIVKAIDWIPDGDFAYVYFQTAPKRYEGWVLKDYIEPLLYVNEEEVEIEDKTINEQDLNQYIVWDGKTQYNLCGELCIAQTFGVSLKTLLTNWQADPTSYYNRIFHRGQSRTTGPGDLANMALCLSIPFAWMPLTVLLRDERTGRTLVSPGRLQKLIQDRWKITVGVSIERKYGRLRSSGIRHWVNILAVTPYGPDNAIVLVYNPVSNRPEWYSWYEFTQSMKTPYGVSIRLEEKTHE